MSLHDLVKSLSSNDAIREKIATGADVNEADQLKRAPIHIAAWAGNIEALQLLVRANASLDAKAMDGFTALHFAAQSNAEGSTACIRFLVKKNKALLKMRITKGNKSALHLAAAKGNMDAVVTLLELGADSSAKTTFGQTPADLAKTSDIAAILTKGYQRPSKRDAGPRMEDAMQTPALNLSGQPAAEPVVNASSNDTATATVVQETAEVASEAVNAPAETAEEVVHVAVDTDAVGASRKRPISEVVHETEG